jgi:hypothetical protein
MFTLYLQLIFRLYFNSYEDAKEHEYWVFWTYLELLIYHWLNWKLAAIIQKLKIKKFVTIQRAAYQKFCKF